MTIKLSNFFLAAVKCFDVNIAISNFVLNATNLNVRNSKKEIYQMIIALLIYNVFSPKIFSNPLSA